MIDDMLADTYNPMIDDMLICKDNLGYFIVVGGVFEFTCYYTFLINIKGGFNFNLK